MAFRAFGDGPYGFSFALNRTTWPVAGMGSCCLENGPAGVTKAAAAPAPSRRAKSRREMEIVFISPIDKIVRGGMRGRIAWYEVRTSLGSAGCQPADLGSLPRPDHSSCAPQKLRVTAGSPPLPPAVTLRRDLFIVKTAQKKMPA